MLKTGIQPSPAQFIEPLSANQRKERLAELITMPVDPEKVTPKHQIMAIDIYNKMTKEYVEQHQAYQDNRQVNIIIQGGSRTREDIERLLSGDMPALEPMIDRESMPQGEDHAL